MNAVLDFEKELDKLLTTERMQEHPDIDESITLETVLGESRRVFEPYFESVSKTQNDISMQVEEIYDILQSAESDKESLRDEKSRINALLRAVLGLSDMIEDFYLYARHNHDPVLLEQAAMMWKNAGTLTESCNISRLGKEGHPLDPSIHSVQSAVSSDLPREFVTQVLRSGYRYKNDTLRKAAVVVSLGKDVQQ